MIKLDQSTLILKKITSTKFYTITKFKRQGCLGEYKKETYKPKFHFNHSPLALESVLNVKHSKQNRQIKNKADEIYVSG